MSSHRLLVLRIPLLAGLAALWATTWLALIATPTGLIPVFDSSYRLMVSPFELSGNGDLMVRRIIEFICLLPAAVLLLAAQAIRKRGFDRAGAGR